MAKNITTRPTSNENAQYGKGPADFVHFGLKQIKELLKRNAKNG